MNPAGLWAAAAVGLVITGAALFGRIRKVPEPKISVAYAAIGLIVVAALGGLTVRSRGSEARLVQGGGPGHPDPARTSCAPAGSGVRGEVPGDARDPLTHGSLDDGCQGLGKDLLAVDHA